MANIFNVGGARVGVQVLPKSQYNPKELVSYQTSSTMYLSASQVSHWRALFRAYILHEW